MFQWSDATNELIYLALDERVVAVTVHCGGGRD
jgi:hypothetical protein